MPKLAFVGLGQMGGPMAARLVDAGHQVTVWNRTPEKAEPLTAKGAVAAGSPAEAAAAAEATITMLSTPDALEQVLFGDEGVSAGLPEGATLIEMSTVGPDVVKDIVARIPSAEVMDAPVLGSVPQATDGSLKIFVGGSPNALERWRDVLQALGDPRHIGPTGSGAAMKLVVNSTLGAVMSTVGEALALGDGFGLERSAVLDVLEGSPVGMTVKRKRPSFESGNYDPNFKLELAVKDMCLVDEAGRDLGLDLKIAAAARRWIEEADAGGFGDRDYSAVVEHIVTRRSRG